MAVLLTANSTGIDKGVKRGQRSLVGLGGTAKAVTASVGKVAVALGAAASAGMALRGTLKVGANFESVMSELQARTGATGDEFARLQDKAEALGRATIFDGDAAGKAMIELTKAGFSTEQTLAAVGDVLNLATAEGVELADAAGYVAGAMKKFEIGAGDAARVTDILSQGAGAALTDIATLSDQLAFAAGPARNAGKSLEETVAAMGALSDQVDKGLAGTGLQQIFAKMAKPSAEAQRELDKLGITFADNQGNWKDLATIVDEFNAAMSNLNPEDAARAMNTIFPTRAGNAFSGLLRAGGDDLRSRLEQIKGAEGRVDGMSKTMQDNVTGAFKGVMSAVKGFAIDIFQRFQDPLKNGLKSVANFINGPFLSAFTRIMNIGGQAFDIVATGVGQLVRWLDPAVGRINELIFGFRDFGEEGITLGAVFNEALIGVEYFFNEWESHLGLGLARLDSWSASVKAKFSHLFSKEVPLAIASGLSKFAKSFDDSSVVNKLLGLAGLDSKSIGAGADLFLQANQLASGFTGGLRPKTDEEQKAQDRVDELVDSAAGGFVEFREKRLAELADELKEGSLDKWKQATEGIADAWDGVGKLNLAVAGTGGPSSGPSSGPGLLAGSSGESQSVINDGIKATEKLAGPELAARGSRSAYDSIYRAIRGSRDRAWQNDSLDALQQIASNTAQQPIDEVVAI